MHKTKTDYKLRLVNDLKDQIARAAYDGELSRTAQPERIEIQRARGIAGPRCGSIELNAGLDTGRLLRLLARNDAAVFRNLVTWNFEGDPAVYMTSRFVRAEAPWPPDLEDKVIRLSEAQERPDKPWKWLAGKSDRGGTICGLLSNQCPHWLIAGMTGSGKTVAMRSALLQLALSGHNKIALVDGKYAEGLGPVAHLPGVVGPVATTLSQAITLLTWGCQEMRARYERGLNGDDKIVIAIDEFQEMAGDSSFTGLLRKLAAQGRAASVHLLLSTQHPSLSSFGDDPTVRRNLSGRVSLKTADYDASKVATGNATTRADFLMGAGDAYVIGPGATHRAQLFYVDDKDIEAAGRGEWQIANWGELDVRAEDVGRELPTPKRGVKKCWTPEQVGAALIAAANSDGRPTFESWLDEHGIDKPGGHGPYKLHRFGKKLHAWLQEHDLDLIELGGDDWD